METGDGFTIPWNPNVRPLRKERPPIFKTTYWSTRNYTLLQFCFRIEATQTIMLFQN